MKSVMFRGRSWGFLLALFGAAFFAFVFVVDCTQPAQAAAANPVMGAPSVKIVSVVGEGDDGEADLPVYSTQYSLWGYLGWNYMGSSQSQSPKRPYGVPTRAWASPIMPW